MSTPKILILGAGYGGLLTTLHLQKKLNYNEAEITLVNKHNYHYITTWLHGKLREQHLRIMPACLSIKLLT